MTRSLLPPIRTRRLPRLRGSAAPPTPDGLTPGTRRTVAAIGALLVSFAVSAAGNAAPGAAAGASAGLNSPVE
jgi:hypothetical protein